MHYSWLSDSVSVSHSLWLQLQRSLLKKQKHHQISVTHVEEHSFRNVNEPNSGKLNLVRTKVTFFSGVTKYKGKALDMQHLTAITCVPMVYFGHGQVRLHHIIPKLMHMGLPCQQSKYGTYKQGIKSEHPNTPNQHEVWSEVSNLAAGTSAHISTARVVTY